jgi:hypothetical protein
MRTPILADHLIAANTIKSLSPKTDWRALQARIRRCERLVFNDESSERVGQVLRDIPELLIEQVQFARAPFDLCWIEYQAEVLVKTLSPHSADSGDLTRDKTVGLLIDHNRVNVFSSTFNGTLCMMPFAYHINTEWPLEDQLRFCETNGISGEELDNWLWGSAANHFIKSDQRDRLRILRDTTMVDVLVQPNNRQATIRMFNGTQGDFKNVIALLLMLNQPRVTQYADVEKRGRGWIGNKPNKSFLEHRTIKVSLDAKARLVAHSQSGEGELRRRHKVMGHYCHDATARDYARIAGCVHNWSSMNQTWEPWPNAPLDECDHWRCDTCGGKRWWRNAHERGSEKSGFIEHDYAVTI